MTNVKTPPPSLHAGDRAVTSAYSLSSLIDYGNARAAEAVADDRASRVQGEAVAEWQASANGGAWRRIEPSNGETLEQRVEYLRNYKRGDGSNAYRIRALYTAPQAETLAVAEGWTMIAPDGERFNADKPISAFMEANKHYRKLNPDEAQRQDMNLISAIEDEMVEHRADRAELVNRFLRWPLPRTVYTDAGTGTVAPIQRPDNWSASGTNLLTADEAAAMLEFVLGCDEGDRELAHRAMIQAAPTPTASIAPKADSDAVAWLVECDGKWPFLGHPGPVQWLTIQATLAGYGEREFSLTSDASKALRFARREDAEAAMLMHLGGHDRPEMRAGFSVAEHMWPALAAPKAEGEAVEPDMRVICEALGFDPTNHHNAAKCPYCRPAAPVAQAAVGAMSLSDAVFGSDGLRAKALAAQEPPTLCEALQKARYKLTHVVPFNIPAVVEAIAAIDALTTPRPEATAVAPVAGEVKS